jgi:hypothetical protein
LSIDLANELGNSGGAIAWFGCIASLRRGCRLEDRQARAFVGRFAPRQVKRRLTHEYFKVSSSSAAQMKPMIGESRIA